MDLQTDPGLHYLHMTQSSFTNYSTEQLYGCYCQMYMYFDGKKILVFVQQNLIIFFSIKYINIFNLQHTLGKFRRCKLMTSFLLLFEKRV